MFILFVHSSLIFVDIRYQFIVREGTFKQALSHKPYIKDMLLLVAGKTFCFSFCLVFGESDEHFVTLYYYISLVILFTI